MNAFPVETNFVDATLAKDLFARVERVEKAAITLEANAASAAEALRGLVTEFGKGHVLSHVVPESRGGVEHAVQSTALCLMRERLGYISPLADLAFAMQGLGTYPVVLAGSGSLRATTLARVVRGELVAAFALTEPEAGSDVSAMTTTATRDGDDYVIHGRKTLISNAGVADFYSVFAVTDRNSDKKRISCFFVPASTPGVAVTPIDVLGDHPIGDVAFNNVRVPALNLLGNQGDGMRVALGTLERFRPTVGAAALGFAQRALDDSVAYVKKRVQFGKVLAEQQLVQSHLADMACDVESSRLLVYRAARTADTSSSRSEIARTGSMAKMIATEAAQRVIDCAVQLHGGRGVALTTHVARLYQDIRALRIYEGTTEIQKLLIARELLRS